MGCNLSEESFGNIGKYRDTNLTSDLSVTLKDIVPGNSNLSLEFSYGNLKKFSGTYPEELFNKYRDAYECSKDNWPEYGSPDILRAVTRSGNYTAVSVKQYINELNDVREYIKLGVVNTEAIPTYKDVYYGDKEPE